MPNPIARTSNSPSTEAICSQEATIAAAVLLHPNVLAQLDAAFRRHHWLVTETGVGALLDQNCRRSNRGRKKQGLDGALYYALQLTAIAAVGQATIEQMYTVARSLPFNTRIEFGLVTYRDGKKVRELTRKQLYTMTEGLNANLTYTTDSLTPAEKQLPAEDQNRILTERQQSRHALVNDIVQRLLAGTRILDITHGTYAIDDTSVWAWSKAPRTALGTVTGGVDRPLADEDRATPDDQPETTTHRDTGHLVPVPDAPEDQELAEVERRDPNSWLCPDAAWGGKTSKSGKDIGFYGYKAHVIVNTNDPTRKTNLPVLIQALELTPANADIVDVSLRLIDQIRDRAPFTRLIGDRHYGYKKFDRWAMELWTRRIHQVLDLRVDKPAPVDRHGAHIIDGRPHCPAVPDHLRDLAPSDDPDKHAAFREAINRRRAYAMHRLKSPLASPSATPDKPDPKVGVTRWVCPALNGTVGCPLREDTVVTARNQGHPIVANPPAPDLGELPKCCTQRTIQIEADPAIKYLQEDYWGSPEWEGTYALRSAVEAVFGNLKNPGTEDVRRGFMQVVGLPLVTLAFAGAAACYNIRILEKYHRETGDTPQHPLMNHPRDGEVIESLLLRDQEVTDYLERTADAA